LYASANIIGVIILWTMKWTGHVTCIEQMTKSIQILVKEITSFEFK